jgi:hypothetical protein
VRLIRDAQSWARTISMHGESQAPATLERIFRETLTFAAYLVTNQLADCRLEISPDSRQQITTALRDEFEQALASIRGDCSMEADDEDRLLAIQVEHYIHGNRAGLAITEEMFARFCEVTGMHTTALVGTGPNLAQIFFYVRVFALVDAGEQLTLEQRKHLLRTAQRCREHFSHLVERAFSAEHFSPTMIGGVEKAARQMGQGFRHSLPMPRTKPDPFRI